MVIRNDSNARTSFLQDDKHYAVNAMAVKLLRDKFMVTVNSQNPSRANQKDIAIADFWERTYLLLVVRRKA
jgi:hypothetical protein